MWENCCRDLKIEVVCDSFAFCNDWERCWIKTTPNKHPSRHENTQPIAESSWLRWAWQTTQPVNLCSGHSLAHEKAQPPRTPGIAQWCCRWDRNDMLYKIDHGERTAWIDFFEIPPWYWPNDPPIGIPIGFSKTKRTKNMERTSTSFVWKIALYWWVCKWNYRSPQVPANTSPETSLCAYHELSWVMAAVDTWTPTARSETHLKKIRYRDPTSKQQNRRLQLT